MKLTAAHLSTIYHALKFRQDATNYVCLSSIMNHENPVRFKYHPHSHPTDKVTEVERSEMARSELINR